MIFCKLFVTSRRNKTNKILQIFQDIILGFNGNIMYISV